ncbi:MAG TPA: 23S rRNA (pseudouridine(1915)-N(3))-methyltransferase RlmH [Steroidobacteraceae bacterium]|nr:23S rRNA (pseudouridine(1915)-N(3))-methyltransferase RlmH [Steroidobacteraceae bacterium]
MKIRVIAVGSRMPGWVRQGFDDYTARLGPTTRIALTEIDPGVRTAGGSPQKAIGTEARRLLAALRDREFVVVLDERGIQMSTRELARWLDARRRDGLDLAFLIGGPDGHAPEVLARGDLRWSLSRLTLPHALVRVVLAEQLYRAHALLGNHPYHRD